MRDCAIQFDSAAAPAFEPRRSAGIVPVFHMEFEVGPGAFVGCDRFDLQTVQAAKFSSPSFVGSGDKRADTRRRCAGMMDKLCLVPRPNAWESYVMALADGENPIQVSE